MKILENNKTVLVKGNVIGFEESTLEPLKYLVQFPDLTTASLSVDMIEEEPQAGHADEAPRYVKNVLARLRELPLHDREVWLKSIMSEFEQDFSCAKWREGYEQGKFEASMIPCDEPQKPVVKQFVADWYEKHKEDLEYKIWYWIKQKDGSENKNVQFIQWLHNCNNDPVETLIKMKLYGYTVEQEAKYTVKVKGKLGQYLGRYYLNNEELTPQFVRTRQNDPSYFTKLELEQTGFDWVFDCPGVEVQEVE